MMEQSLRSSELEQLRTQINDENYLYEAIQRIALVLSNELMGVTKGGNYNERRQKDQ